MDIIIFNNQFHYEERLTKLGLHQTKKVLYGKYCWDKNAPDKEIISKIYKALAKLNNNK